MTIRILHGDIHVIDLQTRLPFKYGIATMTSAPHVFVRVGIEVDGSESVGVSADHLPPKWFTKDPDKSLSDEIDEMMAVVEHAVQQSRGLEGESVYAVWRQLAGRQSAWGRDTERAPLLTQFGTSLVERAVIEAFCRLAGKPFGKVVRENGLGIVLDEFDSRLAGTRPSDWLPAEPLGNVVARHTIGMADPLTQDDVSDAERLDDRLPQSLDECIDQYGLRHFKLKVAGDPNADRQRIARIADVISTRGPQDYAFTLDGNEHFRTLDDFQQFWQRLVADNTLAGFFDHLMFVEQPFHRDVALNESVLGGLCDWPDRPTLIIDESDAEPDSLRQALSIGYHGTSHKNCKGVIKSIANACLIGRLNGDDPQRPFVMSGEDLANVGPVALLQDLTVAATLGVQSVERNGHHYFKGLSAFPATVCEQVTSSHSDLYSNAATGWPTLTIERGLLELGTINRAPFGVGFEIDVEGFVPIDAWRSQ